LSTTAWWLRWNSATVRRYALRTVEMFWATGIGSSSSTLLIRCRTLLEMNNISSGPTLHTHSQW
jgi:hypothetical protein